MKKITEEMKIHDEWYKELEDITLATLPEFLRKLSEDYKHDYGTICHATAASAVAAAKAIDKSPQGGITGFQAGCIMWEFIKRWMHIKDEPLRLTRFKNMLYPQHVDDFTTITQETWKWIQKEAKEKLHKVLILKRFGRKEILFRCFDGTKTHHAERTIVHPRISSHWKTICCGRVPFGYLVSE